MIDDKYILRLYLAGMNTENQDTILDLKRMLKEKLGENYTLEVIDVFDQPELAEGDRIIATPTAVKAMPGPVQKVILDFNSKERLLMGLDVLLDEKK
jgi:circadian clock protein KaiB